MEVIRLCRLCLTFSEYHANIFFDKIEDKQLWRFINSVCELNTFLYDGLPEHICVDCLDTLKNMLSFRNRAIEATSALKLMIQKNKDLVPAEDEIDIEEWQMPKEWKRESMDTEEYGIESELNTDRNIVNIDTGSASSKVILQGPDLPVKQEESEPLFDDEDANQTTRSSDLKNFQSLEASEETSTNSFEGKSSSICTSQDNSIEISDTNKTVNGKDLRADVVPKEESDGLSKSILNDTKSEHSRLKAPLFKSMFVCDICKKSFKAKYTLGNHVRVHNGEKPFACKICDKTFRQVGARYCHELTHIRDKMSFGKSEKGIKKKEFSCTVCGKNLSTKSGLNRHYNIHSDKFKCNSCGRRFMNNYHLIRHSKTHTKEKPFKCEVCFKCFTDKSNLNNHLHIHNSEKTYSCEVCDKSFNTKNYKVKHELSHLRKK